MKNPLEGNAEALEAITNEAKRYIGLFKSGQMRLLREDPDPTANYTYFLMDQDGWEEVVRTALPDEVYKELQMYWTWGEKAMPGGSWEIPDPITNKAMEAAEIEVFGEVVCC